MGYYTARAPDETGDDIWAKAGGSLNLARALCTICWLKGSAVCTRKARSPALALTLALSALALSGCDPVINIAGADFPSWLVCLVVGGILTAILRPMFLRLRLEPHMGPPLLVYLCLALLLSCLTYLMFFNRI
jgi:drug/metabolite transporter (DMT)-like permease